MRVMVDTSETTRIAVCIITRRRPKGLARTLASLDRLELPGGCRLEVIVVDNDEPDSAREQETPLVLGRPVHRVAEPRAGIPFARNRAIEEAIGRSDLLAFIDDDETVEPDWMARLLAVREEHDADVVTGPALPRLPDDSPAWASESGVYGCHRFPTGTSRPWAYTHNVLARTALFEGDGFRFDEGMRFTGGSDTELFRRIGEAGHRIVWADEAIAWEWYPASRVCFRWAFSRSYRIGATDAKMQAARSSRLVAAPELFWLAFRYLVRGVLRLLTGLASPRRAFARFGWDAARATGLVSGLAGVQYDEYRRIHGE